MLNNNSNELCGKKLCGEIIKRNQSNSPTKKGGRTGYTSPEGHEI